MSIIYSDEVSKYFSNYSHSSDGTIYNPRGKVVGSYTRKYGRLFSKFGTVPTSKLIWFLHHGEWPIGEVDHVDGNTHNDSVDNLRQCSRRENAKNRRVYKNSKSGYKGVYSRYGGKYVAMIQVDGERLYLGIFESKEDAAVAYNSAAVLYHKQFASLNGV